MIHGHICYSPRARGTVRAIDEQLRVNGLLQRYTMDDGLPPHEGTFLLCGFWHVQVLAQRGDYEAARRIRVPALALE